MSKTGHHRFAHKRGRKRTPGTPPGVLNLDPHAAPAAITFFGYSRHDFIERQVTDPRELRELRAHWPVCWVNVDGLGNATMLEAIGLVFGLHPLALEDVVNVPQRAKVEEYGEVYFLVVHMLLLAQEIETEQLSLFFGRNWVLTFQERPGWDCLNPVRERVRKAGTHLRLAGADYLVYAILDAVIDHYFPVLEELGERLEGLEDLIVEKPTPILLAQIHELKRELLHLRRTIWPLREALNTLLREMIPHIRDDTRIYLRDCYDHSLRIIDLVETHRETCSDLMDLYLSSLSIRMNDIMKVLTLISTFFIPLTFIAGVYGMNFHRESSPWNMPELDWYWGYPICLGLMVLITFVQILFFIRKGWIGEHLFRWLTRPANKS